MKKYAFMMLALVCMALCGCQGGNKFKVSGNIAGATDSTRLVIEASSNGSWFLVDSATTDAGGNFKMTENAPEVPGIYRLRYGGKSIYFPIDSTDNITINSKLKTFDTDFTVSGSEHAVDVMKIDKQAIKMAGGQATAEQLKAWKRQLAVKLLEDPSGIVAYYVINKYVDEQPIFDPLNDDDMKIIGAVANAYNSFRPSDPRTQYLVQMTLEAQKRRQAARGQGQTVVAEQISLIDINLQDRNGKAHGLQQLASSHKVVVLNFTMYDQQFSPALNKLLNDIYQQYHSAGLEIYQVGLDQNMSEWQSVAKNLPWVAVYDPNGNQSPAASSYNLQSLPTSFVIENGNIVERVENPLQLKTSVSKYM